MRRRWRPSSWTMSSRGLSGPRMSPTAWWWRTWPATWWPSGARFNWKHFGLSFGLKNSLRFHFSSVTCLNYQFLNFFLSVWGISSQYSSVFLSKDSTQPFSNLMGPQTEAGADRRGREGRKDQLGTPQPDRPHPRRRHWPRQPPGWRWRRQEDDEGQETPSRDEFMSRFCFIWTLI